MTNSGSLYGTLTETISARQGAGREHTTRMVAGTEVRLVPATRFTYFVEEYGMGRWTELPEAEALALVEPT